MLSISKLAAGKVSYYLRTVASGVEDYYTGSGEAPGYWTGASAQRLGLHGQVSERDFVRVLAGLDPRDETPLTGAGRGRKRTIPGFDATFSAPKSVSLLWALGDPGTSRTVRRAHDRAVAEALGYLERNATSVRRRGQQVKAEGLVGAAFRHRTSRAGDPALHTHVVVANQAFTVDDGVWRTLDARVLRHHMLTAGYVYQAVLRHDIARDLGASWGPVTKGYADLAGVPRPSSRRSPPARARPAGCSRSWASRAPRRPRWPCWPPGGPRPSRHPARCSPLRAPATTRSTRAGSSSTGCSRRTSTAGPASASAGCCTPSPTGRPHPRPPR